MDCTGTRETNTLIINNISILLYFYFQFRQDLPWTGAHWEFDQSGPEQSTGIQPNSLLIRGNSQSEQRILAASLKARLYSNSTNFNSDALRVVFDASFSDNSSVTLVVRNYVEDSYGPLNDAVFVNTTCIEGDYAEYEHICPGGDMGDMSVLHVCNGSAVVMETRCPTVAVVPVCRVLNGDIFNCTVQSYSTASTVCTCYLVISDSKRRSLSLEGTGALEVHKVVRLFFYMLIISVCRLLQSHNL